MKNPKQMEKHLKGMANHYRIQILLALAQGKTLTLEDIIKKIEGNEKTIGTHVRRLHIAGLIDKKYRGRFVDHKLSPYGQEFVKFLKTFQKM